MQEIYFIKIENYYINNTNEDLFENGTLYTGIGNFSLKKYVKKTNLQPEECEIEFIFSTQFSERYTILNTFHNKNITISVKNLHGKTIVASGMIYNIEIKTGSFFLKIQSNLFKLGQQMTKKYSQLCRASFCDANCGLKIENYTQNLKIVSVGECFIDVSGTILQYLWSGGICIIGGHSYKIRSVNTNTIIFFEKIKCKVGEIATISPVCNKNLEDCKRYANIINFQGEPFIFID